MWRFSTPARRSLLTGGGAALAAAALPALARQPAAGPSSGPWAIELFTSQGCSSCPPADLQLGQLCRPADIVALSFHGDSWDSICWTARFAPHATPERQRPQA